MYIFFFFFSSRRRHTRLQGDWSSDVCSSDLADKIGLIRKSSKRFIDAVRPVDRVAIVTFTADVEVVSTLTSDREALSKSIDKIEKPQGGTNFWDALRFVLEHVLGTSRAEKRRSAVVVMTDGV